MKWIGFSKKPRPGIKYVGVDRATTTQSYQDAPTNWHQNVLNKNTNPTIMRDDMMRSEYFHTFQCTKRIKINLLIHLQKFKNNTSKLFLHIYRSQNMQ